MQVVVTNQNQNTYKYRMKLYDFGLRYTNGKWKLNTSSKQIAESIYRYCKRKKLYCEVIDDKYVRSGDYRKNFLQHYKKKDGKYFRCAYCGKKLTNIDMTVDHILPIDKAQHESWCRAAMRLFGIQNINDVKNLAPACDRCNKKKGKKVRGYLLNGMTGRTYSGVIRRRWIKFFLILTVLIGIAYCALVFLPNETAWLINQITGLVDKIFTRR